MAAVAEPSADRDAEHPLASLGDQDDDVPQGTIRGMATVRAPKAATYARPGYFDLQRLAAQADLADELATSTIKTTRSRTASVYSTTSSRASDVSNEDDDASDDEEETPSWIHGEARRSPLPVAFQPRPITQVLDFSQGTAQINRTTTPSIHGDRSRDMLDEATTKPQQDPVEKLEEELKKAREEADGWKRAYDEEVARHARETSAVKKAHEAREAALLNILTAAGISKARAERALTHATAQSQVPVFRADERVSDSVGRTRSPLPFRQQPISPARSVSQEDRLPASIMEAMLDEFHADLPAASSSQLSAQSYAASTKSESRSQSPSPSVQSTLSRSAQARSTASATSSVNGFFTLNWRRKKPASATANKGREAMDAISARVSPPLMSIPTVGAAATLNNALRRSRKSSSIRSEPNVTRLPALFGRSMDPASVRGATSQDEESPHPSASRARELEPMLAHDVRPPTLSMATGRRLTSPTTNPPSRRMPIRRGSLAEQDEEQYQSSGDEFEVYGGKHLSPEELAQRVSSTIQRQREAGAEDSMLTDRYGFVYDATPADVRLLRQARKEASHAPACLTGIRVGVRARGGSDSQSEDEKDDANLLASDSDAEVDITSDSVRVEVDDAGIKAKIEASLSQSGNSSERSIADPNPFPAPCVSTPGFLDVTSCKPLVGESTLTAASQSTSKAGPTSPEEERLHFLGQVGEVAPTPAVPTTTRSTGQRRPHSTSQTVRRLLTQLQNMHAHQQEKQQAAWDAFLERRKAVLREKGEAAASAAQASIQGSMAKAAVQAVRKGSDALFMTSTGKPINLATKVSPSPATNEEDWTLGGLIGLGQMGTGTKDQQDFRKLIQGGIPLIYRPKIWYECSGAIEHAEPGRYQELLKDHEDEENTCTKQIDLDIGRTMPTNIYFAGDGPGVAKLRRLLVAFSWHNPKCGYCQGMNNLAATLLLTHATEDEAFWVLASMIESILPEDYFTAHLLVAQADQRVVIDLVRELLPKLASHIDELGVDLPAVTFAWFLSLYTDCLPVETLFRVWDVLFVDGMVILFRVAVAIFILNEKDLIATQTPSAFYSLMHSMTSHLFSADKLISMACEDLQASVKMDKIEERRARHMQDLCAELGLDIASSSGQRTPSTSSIQL